MRQKPVPARAGRRPVVDLMAALEGSLAAAKNPATIPAWKASPGAQVLIYGDVAVTVTDVELLPPDRPAQTVHITYRRGFANGTFLIGEMTVPAGEALPVYDDGLAF